MHSLAWVNGRQYSTAWKTGLRLDTEKNVPHRKVIGRMIRLLKVAMLWCDFARRAAIIPRNEKMTQLSTMQTMNRGDSTSSGARNSPNAYSSPQLMSPLTRPSMHFPKMIAGSDNGHIIISSKLL